jgi:hypothetical protein
MATIRSTGPGVEAALEQLTEKLTKASAANAGFGSPERRRG